MLLFYDRLMPLNRDTHAELRLRSGDFRFAATTNSVPLLATEMFEASRSYPIVFIDIGQGEIFPIALLGLRNGENLFIGTDGRWETGHYVPAFVRRYPFVLSNDKTVLIDENCHGLSQSDGERLFTDDGANTPLLETTLAFLRGFQDEVAHTQKFIAALDEFGLLKSVSLRVEPVAGAPSAIDGLMIVDEHRLRSLKDKVVAKLFRSGELAAIHAHLASLTGLAELNRRHQGRADRTGTVPAAAGSADELKNAA